MYKIRKGCDKMQIAKICASCKRGQDSYSLDSEDLFCPYIHCHKGCTCTMYIPMEKTDPVKEKDETTR